MAGQDIEVDIRPDGTFTFHVRGVKGRKCKDLTKFLEELGEVTASENTSEYYEGDVVETAEEHARVERKRR